ncbi:ankyrin repeat domain-containing protein [Piscirickettsia salmonis]|uniref:ankyrin repeat domain-containing protein n=1 Tax=Piscirickettsia salmonis TaxID=1238 RepID=UPI000F07ED58|nr:ankryin [Piscirickettsiaceae bacterium NZ-RLO2]
MPRRLTRPTNTKAVSSFLFTVVRSANSEKIARIPTYLKSGADPNVRYLLEGISYSSIDAAIKWASPDIVQLLLSEGGNPYLNTRGVQWPDDNRIKKQMMDVLFKHSQFKMPPDILGQLLFWGVEHDHIDIVQRTLEMGADPNEYYYLRGSHHKKSLTPFQLTVKLKRRGEMIPLLLQYGADFDLKFHEKNSKDPLTYARENDDDSRFFDFLLDQYHKQFGAYEQVQAGIGLEQTRERPLTDDLDHQVVSFLVEESHHLSFSEFRKQIVASKADENRDQEKEKEQENKRLWSEFCQKMKGRYSDPKAEALASFKKCEPTKRAIRGLITTAAQRQQDGQGETTRLDAVFNLLKKEKYHFILDLLGIERGALTRDALRSIAVHGEVLGGSMKKHFSANRIKSAVDRNGYYCTMNLFFNSIKEQIHPSFSFQGQYNIVKECSIEPAVEPIL